MSWIVFFTTTVLQDNIVTMAILSQQICKRTRDTMILSLVSCSLTETIEILINNNAVINTHPFFGPKTWKIFNCLQKKVAPNK